MSVRVPPNVADRVLGMLLSVGDRMWKQFDHRWTAHGMTESHYNVLRILNGADQPLSQVEISRRLLSSRANVTKIVDRLEERRFVRRTAGEDRRVNLIALQPAGARFLQDTIAGALEFAESLLEPLTLREQKQLGNLLGKLGSQ